MQKCNIKSPQQLHHSFVDMPLLFCMVKHFLYIPPIVVLISDRIIHHWENNFYPTQEKPMFIHERSVLEEDL
jgi:hypothetical protein